MHSRPANVFSNNKNNKMRLESKHPNGILNAFERKTKVETDAFWKNIYVLVLPIENKESKQLYFIFAIRL